MQGLFPGVMGQEISLKNGTKLGNSVSVSLIFLKTKSIEYFSTKTNSEVFQHAAKFDDYNNVLPAVQSQSLAILNCFYQAKRTGEWWSSQSTAPGTQWPSLISQTRLWFYNLQVRILSHCYHQDEMLWISVSSKNSVIMTISQEQLEEMCYFPNLNWLLDRSCSLYM